MTSLKNTTSENKPIIDLVFRNFTDKGPGKVVCNLTAGLDAIDVYSRHFYDARLVDILDYDEEPVRYTGYLQYCFPEILKRKFEQNANVLIGPNFFVTPRDNPYICKSFKHFVVPSQWVKNKYLSFPEMEGNEVHVWPVGIETDRWAPTIDESGLTTSHIEKMEPLDCFIYFKNRSEQDLRIAEALCKKNNLKYEVLRYGQYNEEPDLVEAVYRSKFAILLTGTESQGVAYMQILSTNTPCYVFNASTWKSEDGKYEFPATSVPYFDDRCGMIAEDVDKHHFQDFLSKIDEFRPRDYIVENHTLERAAQRYYHLLKVANDEEEEIPYGE